MPDLRQNLRNRRQSLSPEDRERHSLAIAGRLARYLPYRRARKVAFYMATPEEADTTPAIHMAMTHGKTIFLPVINTRGWRKGALLFHEYVPGESELRRNRFGIPEPAHRIGTCVQGTSLDLVCVPLVGFNDRCDRIGMGAGYYDKTFGDKTFGPRTSTRLVGLAFSCQRAEFEPAPHDVPMQAIVTEEGILERE